MTGCRPQAPARQAQAQAQAPGPPDLAALYRSIYADYLHGRLDMAQARAAAAREACAGSGPGDNPGWELKFRLLDAEILTRQGRPKQVDALLSGQDATIPATGNAAIEWQVLGALAHWRLNRKDDALRELQAARRLAESTRSTRIGDVLRTEALVARDSHRAQDALAGFGRSLRVAQQAGDVMLQAVDLVDIGFGYLQDGQYDQAIRWSRQAADFAGSVQAGRQQQIALGNTGWAEYNLGDFDNALDSFRAAEQQAQTIGMVGNRVLWLQDAGLAAYRLGRWQEARQYDEQALQVALTLPAADETDQIANIRANLALLLYGEGRYADARAYSDAAIQAAAASDDHDVVAYAAFLRGLIAARLPGAIDPGQALLSALRLATDPDLRTDIENALGNLYAERHEPARAEHWYRRSIQTFEVRRSSVHDEALRLSMFAYGDATYRNYADFLIAMHRPDEALQWLDRARARTLEEGLGLSAPETAARAGAIFDAPALAARLGGTILFYSLGPEHSWLWAITAHGTRLSALPPQSAIQSLLTDYQRAIQESADPLRTANGPALALYDALVRPAAALLAPGTRVFILPDGILHGLNFETLLVPGGNGPRYWIDDVTVTVTSSIRILARGVAAPASGTTRDLLLIGDPLQARQEFAALPNASAEMQRIRRHFPADSQTVLGQSAAVPAAYAASNPDRYRYIHFVAHGTASRSSPLDSAVILSPAAANPQDFKLYARDIVHHPLRAELVTVSACYGSGLRAYAGEGLVGLSWAFLRAGAHNVIAALWLADDAATPLLMDQMYAELQAGRSPSEALRAAKLSLIHSDSVYRKPYYWGAFQLYAGS